MDHVAELVLTPFREIVEKGKLAADNAGGSEPMARAAHALTKEGERALKRLDPLCEKHLEEHGASFVDAIKENDDISSYRSQLTDLLWEFDDYLDADSFDADKYAELQAASRKAAPKIYDLLMRMKLKASPRDTDQSYLSQFSPPSTPHPIGGTTYQPPPLQPGHGQTPRRPLAIHASSRSSVASSQAGAHSDVNAVDEVNKQLQMLLRSQEEATDALDLSSTAMEQPLRLSSGNSWSPHAETLSDDGCGNQVDGGPVTRPESPVDPAISPLSPSRDRQASRTIDPSVSIGSEVGADDWRQYSSSAHSVSSALGFSTLTKTSKLKTSIPEEEPMVRSLKPLSPVSGARYSPFPPPAQRLPPLPLPPLPLPPLPLPPLPRRMSGESAQSISATSHQLIVVSSEPVPEALSPVPPTTENYTAQFEQSLIPDSLMISHRDEPASERRFQVIPPEQIDMGLIPVEPSESIDSKQATLRPSKDCLISASASFYHHKGFCEGAKEVMRGDIGIKKPQRRVASRSMAKCTGCLYELDMSQIKKDIDLEVEGNLIKCDVGYRLRFLQKSHLPAKRADDVLYGCIFCIHEGHTIDGSDATVFFTTKSLFAHLARHPRPLPEVPGLTVVDGLEVPPHLNNNYDLHFIKPPLPHPVQEAGSGVDTRPTGIARDQARRIYGQRLLYDRTEALELAQGARLSGIKWPPKYNGEWAMAWHDGIFASVPTEMIQLDRPPSSEIKMGGTSHVKAKARWKFAPKDKDKGDWLKFDKNETIANISWAYADHWCWSGTNAKGKWGIFPRAFIDPKTVQQQLADNSDLASSLSSEKVKSNSGLLSRFALRSSSRPSSVAGSVSSGDKGTPGHGMTSVESGGP